MDTTTCTPVRTAACTGSAAARTSVAPVSRSVQGRVSGTWLRGPVPTVLASGPTAQDYALVMDIDVTDHNSVIDDVFEGTRGPSAWSPPT